MSKFSFKNSVTCLPTLYTLPHFHYKNSDCVDWLGGLADLIVTDHVLFTAPISIQNLGFVTLVVLTYYHLYSILLLIKNSDYIITLYWHCYIYCVWLGWLCILWHNVCVTCGWQAWSSLSLTDLWCQIYTLANFYYKNSVCIAGLTGWLCVYQALLGHTISIQKLGFVTCVSTWLST